MIGKVFHFRRRRAGVGGYCDRAEFDADLQRIHAYYADRGYPGQRVTGVQVDTSQDQQSVKIRVDLDEGQPVVVDEIRFDGFDVLPANVQERLKNISLKVGEPRDRDKVRDARDEQIRLGRGYDHNWVAARAVAAAPRPLAHLEDPLSGRVMELLSDQPGLQFYSGNFLDGTSWGKAGRLYRMGDGIALEPQLFPDTPNRPEFGSARLALSEIYRHHTIWRFSVA